MSGRHLPWLELERVVTELFITRHVPPPDAALVARHLVRADARGVSSHGVMRLSFYLPKLDAGTLEPTTSLTLEAETPVVKRFSANNGLGQVAAAQTMDAAVSTAKEMGIGAVLVRRSNHFGVAQLHTLRAVEANVIGVALSNASPALAPTGGAERLLGNNPWSVAVPSTGEFPIVIDMANTVAARGKIITARNEGRPIPPDWAIGPDGRPTTDPQEALAGILLPIGGHKGYAISLAVDLLTGVLGGSGFLADVNYPGFPERIGNVSQLFLAIDPKLVAPAGYEERVAEVTRRIKSAKRATGVDEIYLPGELEYRREERSRQEGISLSDETLAIVEGCAGEAGVSLSWDA